MPKRHHYGGEVLRTMTNIHLRYFATVARHGSIREPSMKGGGNVFGPRPRDYSQRMPRQMRRLALRSALSPHRW